MVRGIHGTRTTRRKEKRHTQKGGTRGGGTERGHMRSEDTHGGGHTR